MCAGMFFAFWGLYIGYVFVSRAFCALTLLSSLVLLENDL